MNTVFPKWIKVACCLSFLLTACGGGTLKDPADRYELAATEDKLSFTLEDNTTLLIKAMFLYTDPDGREYLTFQNDKEPQIFFYDIQTQRLAKKLELEREGSDGVGRTIGYYIKNMDEIFLTSAMTPEFYVVDGAGKLLRKMDVRKWTDFPLWPFPSISFRNTSVFFVGDKVYLYQDFNRQLGFDDFLAKSPLTIMYDTLTHEVMVSDFKYPLIRTESDLAEGRTCSVEFSCCREYDGKRVIYSFGADEDLYVTNLENRLERKVKAKSRYIDDVTRLNMRPADIKAALRKMSEVPLYGNLLYDKYRDVYYRVAYPETEVDPSLDGGDLWQFGRSRFSIMILDKDLRVIGETLFPDNIYISTLMFIREDGLYISDSHFLNSDFSDDELRFHRFELRKK
ncbi:MAG: hypothetical protein PARBB_02238 [Parabacteroides distasonis]|uniref:DUF4221 family protein n=1 Tax=Parabacteroides sp. TaxID=1869337 RepID=UPI00257FDED0|nr:DUF4221 family protein [Parabacteroides sp.]